MIRNSFRWGLPALPALICMSAYGPSSAAAQDFPTKPVLVIVPYSQGSATDVIGRALSRNLSEFWGQPVTVENRPGGGLGVDAVAKSSPDGCTLLVDSSAYAASTAICAKSPYDPGKDLVAIAPFGRRLFALGVTSTKRSSVLPDVLTMAEAGVAGVEAGNWWGPWAPAGTPAGVLAEVEKDVARALEAPDLIEQFAKKGLEPMKMTSAAFGELAHREIETAKQTVRALGIKPQ